MAAIDFPTGPTVGQTYAANERTWVWSANDTWDTVETGTAVGPTGPTGPAGVANTLTIGSVSSTNPDGDPLVSITGTSPVQELSFVLKQGPTGPATSISLDPVNTGLPGSTAAASITGPPGSQILTLTIPQGPTGPAGSLGSAVINDLNDVTIEGTSGITLADGQMLTYDTTTGKWINSSEVSNLKLSRVNSAEEGGEISLARASDDASYWFIDVFGSTSTPSLRFIQDTSTRMSLDSSGLLTAQPAIPTNTNSADNVGYVGMPQVSTATGLSLTAAHAGKHIYTTATGQTHTIPANSSVPLEIGTTIVFINQGAISTSIAITSDTLQIAGASTAPGTRTLGTNGMATAVKVGATSWIISGNGLT